MSEDVADLSIEQLKRELMSLKRENNAAMATVNKLLKDLNKKQEEIDHLKDLLSKSVPITQVPVVVSKDKVTAEEDIAERQLEKLRQASQNRSLTLEEIRAYDLLVKNKRLAQDKSTKNVSQGNFRDVSDIELEKIAGKIKESDGE